MIPRGYGPGGEHRPEETPGVPDRNPGNGYRTLNCPANGGQGVRCRTGSGMKSGMALKMQAGNYDPGEVALKGAVAPGE